MGLFDIFKTERPQSDISAYNTLSKDEICRFYLNKIPKYCPIDRILWIEAAVIENGTVKSFRITYFDEEELENTDVTISFRRYGHKGMSLDRFRAFLKYLSIALHKSKFLFVERTFGGYSLGSVYRKSYARRLDLI